MKICVYVKTNSNKNELIKEEDEYYIRLKAKPVDGEANKELIKFLSKEFKKKARIVSGFNSKRKIIELF